jgi:hypothetical protein
VLLFGGFNSKQTTPLLLCPLTLLISFVPLAETYFGDLTVVSLDEKNNLKFSNLPLDPHYQSPQSVDQARVLEKLPRSNHSCVVIRQFIIIFGPISPSLSCCFDFPLLSPLLFLFLFLFFQVAVVPKHDRPILNHL